MEEVVHWFNAFPGHALCNLACARQGGSNNYPVRYLVFIATLFLMLFSHSVMAVPDGLDDLKNLPRGETTEPLRLAVDMKPEECRFKSGLYHQKLSAPIGTIQYEITTATLIGHRKVNELYVKNRLEWVGDCTYKLITIKVHDPILEDNDWPGKEADYTILAIKGNDYIIRDNKRGIMFVYTYIQPEIPWKQQKQQEP